MSNFANTFARRADMTTTENGAVAFSTTGSSLLDLFANIGGMRRIDEETIIKKWLAARQENETLADNLILYTRDIRNQGIGERRIGRILLRELAKINPTKVANNLDKIVDCGRWDDLFVLLDGPAAKAVWVFIEEQLRLDIEGMKKNQPISIFAKWAPSINTSSKETRALAKRFCKELGLSERTYRKTLSALRRHIGIVERLMSAGEWDKINFETVPSVAMSRYINTYNKRCRERFEEYKASLIKGEAKINAATLTPTDIALKYLNNGKYLDAVDEAQWDNLTNYVNGGFDVVCVADVSGSMMWDSNRPMAASIGLATYFAQRNKGAYHGMYMTFSREPSFIHLRDGKGIKECFDTVMRTEVGYNTDLNAVFEAVYETAVKAKEAPRAIVVISDMEIDSWFNEGDFCASIVSKWNEKYQKAGLEAPKLICWNVESRHGTVLAQQNEKVAFCSGYSASVFANLITLITKSAYDAMVEILSKSQFCWK